MITGFMVDNFSRTLATDQCKEKHTNTIRIESKSCNNKCKTQSAACKAKFFNENI